MCNAQRHFIKDLGVGGGEKKENEDDRMRSGGERDWEWRWRGGEFRGWHLIGLPVTGQAQIVRRSSSLCCVSLQKCLGCWELECLLKVCLVKVKSTVCKRFTRLKKKCARLSEELAMV